MTGHTVEQADPLNQPVVRHVATKPKKSWGPRRIVTGFLSASASFRNGHEVARDYLAPGAGSHWQPGSGITVYSEDTDFKLSSKRTSTEAAVVTLDAPRVGTIDARGHYTPSSAGSHEHAVFRLRKVGANWRIVNLPKDLLLTARDLQRTFTTLNLYFYAPGYGALVPDPVYVLRGEREQLPTQLVRQLIRGATSWLAPAVRTAFPGGVKLIRPVEVSNGVATVKLGGAALTADAGTLAHMSAQLAWTLGRQLPQVEQIRMVVDGDAVRVPGAGELVSREDWASLEPGSASGTVPGYVVGKGRLRVTSSEGLEAAAGPAGTGSVSVDDVAISLDGKHAAWVSGQKLVVAQLREGGRRDTRLTGERLVSPSWDRYGNLWVVEIHRPEGSGAHGDSHAGKGSRGKEGGKQAQPRSTVWMLGGGGKQPVKVNASALRRGKVQALRVSRDGTRVAVVVDRGNASHLLLGRIERSGDSVAIGGFVPLATGLARILDVAWRDVEELAVLGKDPEGTFGPYTVDVDGSRVAASAAVPSERVVELAAHPGAPTLAATADGQIWLFRDDMSWELLASGTDPVYPG